MSLFAQFYLDVLHFLDSNFFHAPKTIEQRLTCWAQHPRIGCVTLEQDGKGHTCLKH